MFFLDLDIFTPFFVIMPCVKSRSNGSENEMSFMSRSTFTMNREYRRCRIACSTPPIYWFTGSHRFTAGVSNGLFESVGLRKRRKYQLESTKVSMVSVSRRAVPPHFGHFARRNFSFVRSGDSPVGLNST